MWGEGREKGKGVRSGERRMRELENERGTRAVKK
jgi:hypothetical protein